MTTVPRNDAEGISFFLQHSPDWLAHAAEYGLTIGQAGAMVELARQAEAARLEALIARENAERATRSMREAIENMRREGGAIIMTIKARAAADHDPELSNRAGVSPPSTRRAPLPPAQPRIVEVKLDATGAARLRWMVRHTHETRAEGTTYFVQRQLPSETVWKQIGATGGGVRRGAGSLAGNSGWMFTDSTLPTGLGFARYRVVPRRAGIEGPPSNEWNQPFGAIGRMAA